MFDNLPGIDLVMIAAMVCFVAWEAYGLIRSRGKIQMKAKVYGRYISLAIIAVLLGVALFQRRADMASASLWIVLGSVVVAGALYVLLPSGFGEAGLYFNGQFHPFGKIQYYSVERETERGFSLRLHASRREFVLDFSLDQKPLTLAWMDKAKIVDFETYLAQNR